VGGEIPGGDKVGRQPYMATAFAVKKWHPKRPSCFFKTCKERNSIHTLNENEIMLAQKLEEDTQNNRNSPADEKSPKQQCWP
jgi:hypothetical protein